MTEETKELLPPVSIAPLTPEKLSAMIEQETKNRALIVEYVTSQMKEGTDYGTIFMGGRESKPTLFKAGAEKFTSLFHLRAEFTRDDATWEMTGKKEGLFCYVCRLYQGSFFVAEGRGACDVKQKNNDINTAIKIAQKRSQIDAVLRYGALSDFFTQDLEDMAHTQNQLPPEIKINRIPLSQMPHNTKPVEQPVAAMAYGLLAVNMTVAKTLDELKSIWTEAQKQNYTEEQIKRLTQIKDTRKEELSNEQTV